MAKCEYCGKDMLRAKGCIFKSLISSNGKKVARQRVGDEGTFEPGERCGDCGAKYGAYHHFGCDIECCPICGEQAAFCDCRFVKMEV